jgi:glycosyltransferase involved in cell wall biosynthesis
MKVAFVCQLWDKVHPPHQNSIGIWTYEVARRLGTNCETTVIVRRRRKDPTHVDIEGARVESLTPCVPMRVWIRASRLWSHVRSPAHPLFAQSFYGLDFIAQAVWRIRRLAPHVVHIPNFPQYAPMIRRAAPNAAIVLHMHCDWLVQLDRATVARALTAVDVVAGCSAHVTSAARERFADTGVRFAVLPNGAPVERLEDVMARRTPGKVLFVGRLSPEKGVHTLLDAWPRVVAARPDARLDIVGPSGEAPREFIIDLSDDPDLRGLSRFYPRGSAFKGSYDAALRAMIPAQIAHTVSFVGHETHERVIARCAASAVFVNAALWEAFAMPPVEALGTGTPVVMTRVGGASEFIEATGGGLLVEKNDPDALADAIIRLLADPSGSAELGRRGAQRVAKLYSWTRVAALTRDLYAEALSARRESAKRFGCA